MSERKIERRLTLVGVLGNIVLVAFKLYAGVLGNSAAMLSDAVHSLSDVFATFVAFVGARISRKQPDKDHPYGHDRLECLASLLLGCILLATGLGIGWGGAEKIISGSYKAMELPGGIALTAAAVSIVTKEAMFWYTRHYAKKLNSSVFMADAWHHRSDALSSVGSFIGIGGAQLGLPVLEPLACVIICLCIIKVAADIILDAGGNMLDSACSQDFEDRLSQFIEVQPGVQSLDRLQTRKFGSKIYIDAEIGVDGSISLYDAHLIADGVHDAVEREYPDTKHIMIHENPVDCGKENG